MSEATETSTQTAAPETVHQAEVASPATSLVDAAFDAGTKAVVDVLSFTREALKKSATALEESAKKLDELSTTLKH